jgi:hypothetical protein
MDHPGQKCPQFVGAGNGVLAKRHSNEKTGQHQLSDVGGLREPVRLRHTQSDPSHRFDFSLEKATKLGRRILVTSPYADE